MIELVGADLAEQVRAATLAIYRYAAEYAAQRGILIADTKLEFGLDEDNRLHVMDEMLTPDSSRFWPADEYRVGSSPPSYDKQFVRDYLETLDWNKTAPGPTLPVAVIAGTVERYAEALRRLTADVQADRFPILHHPFRPERQAERTSARSLPAFHHQRNPSFLLHTRRPSRMATTTTPAPSTPVAVAESTPMPASTCC